MKSNYAHFEMTVHEFILCESLLQPVELNEESPLCVQRPDETTPTKRRSCNTAQNQPQTLSHNPLYVSS